MWLGLTTSSIEFAEKASEQYLQAKGNLQDKGNVAAAELQRLFKKLMLGDVEVYRHGTLVDIDHPNLPHSSMKVLAMFASHFGVGATVTAHQ